MREVLLWLLDFLYPIELEVGKFSNTEAEMSKMKSKFRPKTKSVKKPSELKIWCVRVTEHERDWGIRTDDLLEFPSEEKAVAYAESYNKKSAEIDTPDHFFHAIAFAKDVTDTK